jgi:hypothetical protein
LAPRQRPLDAVIEREKVGNVSVDLHQ